MSIRHLRWGTGLFPAMLTGLLLLVSVAPAQGQKDKDRLELNKIPKVVMDALNARFSNAEIHQWTREKEGDIVIYDIEFKQGGRKGEADIKEDGTYHSFEREIAAKDLPQAVKQAVERKYPKATLKEVMEITEVRGKDERLEGYELVLETADKKEVEVTVAPDGRILEESGVQKQHNGSQISCERACAEGASWARSPAAFACYAAPLADSSAPVLRVTSMVRNRENFQPVRIKTIDKAVRKPANRKGSKRSRARSSQLGIGR